MVLSPVGVTDPAIDWFFSSLSVIVGERENELATAPKWVSFSSGQEGFVSAEGRPGMELAPDRSSSSQG